MCLNLMLNLLGLCGRHGNAQYSILELYVHNGIETVELPCCVFYVCCKC